MEPVVTFAQLEDCVDFMDIHINTIDGVTVIELEGSFDSKAAHDAQEIILPATDSSTKILLDMSKVTYMSSAGLRILLLLYRRISENIGHIIITGLSEELRDVMSITGFLDFFATAANRETAMKNLKSA